MTRIALLLLLFMSGSVFAEPKLEGTASELERHLNGLVKTVSIEAIATTKIPSDKAVIKLLIETEAPALAKALESNSKNRESIRNQLKVAGIEEGNIRESKFSSTPEYGLFGDKPKSYRVENILAIVVSSESQMISVASISDTNENVRYLSSNAEVGDRSKIKAGLLAQALGILKEKVEIYQNKLGVVLTPSSFSESSFDALELNQSQRGKSKISSYSSDEESSAKFGETEFTLSVTADYKLTAQ